MLIFARFQLGTILRGKNVLALQVFGGVNVLGPGLLVLLAGAFLTSRFRNALLRAWSLGLVLALLSLLLGTALLGARKGERKSHEKGDTNTTIAGRGLRGSQVADPGWGVKIRTCHAKPTDDGDNAWYRVYPKRPSRKTATFSRRRAVARSSVECGVPAPPPVRGRGNASSRVS